LYKVTQIAHPFATIVVLSDDSQLRARVLTIMTSMKVGMGEGPPHPPRWCLDTQYLVDENRTQKPNNDNFFNDAAPDKCLNGVAALDMFSPNKNCHPDMLEARDGTGFDMRSIFAHKSKNAILAKDRPLDKSHIVCPWQDKYPSMVATDGFVGLGGASEDAVFHAMRILSQSWKMMHFQIPMQAMDLMSRSPHMVKFGVHYDLNVDVFPLKMSEYRFRPHWWDIPDAETDKVEEWFFQHPGAISTIQCVDENRGLIHDDSVDEPIITNIKKSATLTHWKKVKQPTSQGTPNTPRKKVQSITSGAGFKFKHDWDNRKPDENPSFSNRDGINDAGEVEEGGGSE
jgi:hypothetical protein